MQASFDSAVPASSCLQGSSSETACSHCGLPVASGLLQAGALEQFCCSGCRAVYRMIHEAGLSNYYRLRQEASAPGVAAEPAELDYTNFDAPSFLSRHTRSVDEGLVRVELYLPQVQCAACLWLLEKLPGQLPGVREARLDLGRQVLDVAWEPARVSLSQIATELARLGYPPRPHLAARVSSGRREEERKLLLRVGVAGAVFGNVMLLAFALYGGLFEGMSVEARRLFSYASLFISLPSVLWAGSTFYSRALGALRVRTAHMDQPVSLGILVGFFWGAYSVFSDGTHLYFDSVTGLLFFLLAGRYLELRQQNRARDAMERAQLLTPAHAERISDGGSVTRVLTETLEPGDRVLIKPGATIPVDGRVVRGSSRLDTAILTGESRPVGVEIGDLVYAGSVNLTRAVELEATRSGAESRVAKLLEEVERTRRRRAPLVHAADRVASYFIVAVLALAVVTLVAWWFIEPARAVPNTVALLIVACPCALALATPLAMSSALAQAFRQGILIKGGDALEALQRGGYMVFDKTGTLTEGRLTLVKWLGPDSLKPWVRALEQDSRHPVAQAFVKALEKEPSVELLDRTELLSGGVQAVIDGHRVLVGSRRLVEAQGCELPSWAERAIAEHSQNARTPALVTVDGEVCALAFFEDPPKPDAARCLVELTQRGFRLALLSGDDERVTSEIARRLAQEAGVPALFDEVFGGQSPEAKRAYVERMREAGFVVVVGDGVNDAAALASANVGVAVRGSAEASLTAADVYLARGGLHGLVELTDGAARVSRVVRRGLALSLVYNVVGVSLAVVGWVAPLVAAVLMPLSSITVVANAYRSRSFGVTR